MRKMTFSEKSLIMLWQKEGMSKEGKEMKLAEILEIENNLCKLTTN